MRFCNGKGNRPCKKNLVRDQTVTQKWLLQVCLSESVSNVLGFTIKVFIWQRIHCNDADDYRKEKAIEIIYVEVKLYVVENS